MYPIKIRAGHENGTELDFNAAVFAAMGIDEQICTVHVTAVYAEDEPFVIRSRYSDRNEVHPAGSAVFGMGAELRAREVRYGQDRDAQVSIAGIGGHSPEEAMVRAQCYTMAAQIAAAANAAAAALAARSAS